MAVAPHAATTRWTYTVPGDRVTMVMAVNVEAIRDVAPTTAARARVHLEEVEGANLASIVSVNDIGNAINTGGRQASGMSGVLVAGDSIRAITVDASTAGSYIYEAHAALGEFDD